MENNENKNVETQGAKTKKESKNFNKKGTAADIKRFVGAVNAIDSTHFISEEDRDELQAILMRIRENYFNL